MLRSFPRQTVALLLFAALAFTAGCASDRKTQEAMRRGTTTTTATPTQPTKPGNTGSSAAPALPGNQAELKAALAEASPITYKVEIIDVEPTPDLPTYFDTWLEQGHTPTGNTLLLAVFSHSNYDIRFALGPEVTAKKLSVDDLLAAVRAEYLPATRDGDPSMGIARLVRAINRKLTP